MTATQQTESTERIARPLIQLAKLNGISTSYIDQLGTYVEIRDEVLVSVLAALGVDASSDEAIAASYELTKQRIADTLVEPTIVKFIGKEATTPIRAKGHDVTLRLLLEDGTRYEGNLCMYLAPQTDGSLTLTLVCSSMGGVPCAASEWSGRGQPLPACFCDLYHTMLGE